MHQKSSDERPIGKHLTIDDIRAIEGYEDLSDEKAQELLNSIQQYVQILVEFASKQIKA